MAGTPSRKSGGGVVIDVRVVPRSSTARVIGLVEGVLKVKLTAPPVDGAANKELIKLLSSYFQVRKRSVRILRGESSKNKRVAIEGLAEDSIRLT